MDLRVLYQMELTFNEVYISHQMKTKPWILNKTWITVDLPVWPYLAEIAKSGRFHYRTSTNTWTWEITTFVEIQMEVATHKILTSPLLKKVLHAGQRGRVLQCFHNPVRRLICCCERLKMVGPQYKAQQRAFVTIPGLPSASIILVFISQLEYRS